MDIGHFSDKGIPVNKSLDKFYAEFADTGKLSDKSYTELAKQGLDKTLVDSYIAGAKIEDILSIQVNSLGYRCPEFNVPEGKKNVVILGCSHTFGVGHAKDTHWVSHLSKHNTKLLRYWNLAVPGCSGDRMVRILYGAEKIIFPKIIICCWPNISRRERLDKIPIDLFGRDKYNRFETDETDKQNFLKNLFFVEHFAEAKIFHCFAEEVYEMPKEITNVLDYATLKSCWPPWDDHNLPEARKERITNPNFAQDGIHYGEKHHLAFAELFLSKFRLKLK